MYIREYMYTGGSLKLKLEVEKKEKISKPYLKFISPVNAYKKKRKKIEPKRNNACNAAFNYYNYTVFKV